MSWSNIPEELKARPRWVCFDEKKNPIDPRTGYNARSNDPATWTDFQQAADGVALYGCKGVGFMLGDGIAGVDIDHCIDPATGKPSALAAEIAAKMDSYTEYSPSGTGLHILFLGAKPAGACRSSALGLEMYDKGRYFTVTGRVFGEPRLLAERSEQATAVHAKYLAKPAAPLRAGAGIVSSTQGEGPDTAELLRRAAASREGERFSALLAGNWQAIYPSQSEADLGFCGMLAFWLGCDPARMDETFRGSGLYRTKWDERRGAKTYGQLTIERAIGSCQEVYDPAPRSARSPDGGFADATTFFAGRKAAKQPTKPQPAPAAKPAPASPRVLPPLRGGSSPGKKKYSLDDTGNARRFVDTYGDRIRYNPTDRVWMLWDGRLWQRDEQMQIKQLCDAMLDGMEKSVFGVHDTDAAQKLRAHITKSRGSRAKEAFLKESQHLPGVPMMPAQFDRARGLLNLQNGILDLAGSKLRPHDRAQYLTRIAGPAYDPSARCPGWEDFLRDITGGDTSLIGYLQGMVGYMLTGSTREQCIFFLYGDGSNGKSTFLEVLSKLMGSYAMNVQSETITSQRQKSAGARSDIARLKGARLVTVSESEEGVYLDESLVKQLTGGDLITARFLYGREFEFRPEFKLIMATNHKPRIRGTDEGIWRRIRLVPFTRRIPPEKQDLQLPDKLAAELPGILNWALTGLAAWLRRSEGGKRRGLPACSAVTAATAEYKTEQDRLQLFLETCTLPAPGQSLQAAVFYRIYQKWCEENGERYPISNNKFGREIGKVYSKKVGRFFSEYEGVGLTEEGRKYLAWATNTPGVSGVRSGSKTGESALPEQLRLPKS